MKGWAGKKGRKVLAAEEMTGVAFVRVCTDQRGQYSQTGTLVLSTMSERLDWERGGGLGG